jgi:hypothetical protein
MRMGSSRRPLKPEDQGANERQAGVVLRGRVRLLDKVVDPFLRQPQRPGPTGSRVPEASRGPVGIEGQRVDD